MPQPTLSEVEWNTDGTNELTPTAAHKSDGWGVAGGGKLANSQMMNWWKRRVYNWIAWFRGRTLAPRYIPVSMGAARDVFSSDASYGAFINNGRHAAMKVNDVFILPIPVNDGEQINEIIIKLLGDTGTTVTITLWNSDTGACSDPVTSTLASTTQYLTLNEAVGGAAASLAENVSFAPGAFATYFLRCVTSAGPHAADGPLIEGAKLTVSVP